MIQLFKEVNNALQVQDVSGEDFKGKIEPNMWIHMVSPTVNDVKMVCEATKLNEAMLLGALDVEEAAHLDIDDDDTLITLDVPLKQDELYETLPFAMMYNNNFFVTLCTQEADVVKNVIAKVKKVEPHKHVRLSLQIMYRIATMYITSLKVIDKETKEVESILHNSMRNQELFDLMSINKALVYLSTSLNSNKVVFGKVKRLSEYKRYEDDFDLMEDVEVENNQAIEMCTIYRDILSGTMDAYASIISNNLNIVMKVLAVVTLVLSIPTLIASLFGMNVAVPLANNKAGFYIIMGISIVLSIIGSIVLFKYTNKTSKK